MHTVAELRGRTDAAKTALRSLVRRVVAIVTNAGSVWNFRGYVDAAGNQETFDRVEVFQGIGFSARPAAGGRPEAIVLNVGGGKGHPVAVATRDRRLVVTSLAEGETAIHNAAGARVHLMADGAIVIRAASGKTISMDDGSGAVALATKADVDALTTYVKKQFNPVGTAAGHVHAVVGGATTTITEGTIVGLDSCPSPSGTSVAKGK